MLSGADEENSSSVEQLIGFNHRKLTRTVMKGIIQALSYRRGVVVTHRSPNPMTRVRFLSPVPTPFVFQASFGLATDFHITGRLSRCSASGITRKAWPSPQVYPITEGALTNPDGLTYREVGMLALVAVGKSNADIAEDLVICANTVVRHMSNILAKTQGPRHFADANLPIHL